MHIKAKFAIDFVMFKIG